LTPLSARTLPRLDGRVAVPRYDRDRVSVGIVHIGPGAFHRAHQAMYLDSYLATGDPSWGICTVGLLQADTTVRDVLDQQDGLYTLVSVSPDGHEDVRVIGSIVQHLHAPDRPAAVLDLLTRPTTRIVTMTITEGGYGVDDSTGEFEPSDALTRADLRSAVPASALGFIVAALGARRKAGTPPFAVVSCDNIQGNGHVAASAVTGFAARRDPELAAWIRSNVSFPSSMVDRITPRTDEAARGAARRHGIDDRWPIRAESFAQWVCEDRFSEGRPELERVGVQWVSDVEPYEKLKLRLLNSSHQALAYLGLLSGYEHVHAACRDPLLVGFLRGYQREEAAPTLPPVPGIDVGAYGDQVLARFAGDAVPDTLARLTVDGSDRVGKFLVPVIADLLAQGRELRRSALVLAAWTLHLDGRTAVAPVDRRLAGLRDAVAQERTEPGAVLGFRPVFGELGSDPTLRRSYLEARKVLTERDVRNAIAWSGAGGS